MTEIYKLILFLFWKCEVLVVVTMQISYLGCDTLQFDRNFQKFLKTILPPFRRKIEAAGCSRTVPVCQTHIILPHTIVILILYISHTSPGIWKRRINVCRALKGNVYQYYIIIYWQEEINIQNWKEWSTWRLFCYLEVFISSKCLFIRLFSISWQCIPQGLHTTLGDQCTCNTCLVSTDNKQQHIYNNTTWQCQRRCYSMKFCCLLRHEKHMKSITYIYIYMKQAMSCSSVIMHVETVAGNKSTRWQWWKVCLNWYFIINVLRNVHAD